MRDKGRLPPTLRLQADNASRYKVDQPQYHTTSLLQHARAPTPTRTSTHPHAHPPSHTHAHPHTRTPHAPQATSSAQRRFQGRCRWARTTPRSAHMGCTASSCQVPRSRRPAGESRRGLIGWEAHWCAPHVHKPHHAQTPPCARVHTRASRHAHTHGTRTHTFLHKDAHTHA